MYPYKFTNIHEFVQRVADNVVKYGYRYYVTGTIPEGKSAGPIDKRILEKYSIAVSRWTRARRKSSGISSIHYARHQEFFVMFAHAKASKEGLWFQSEGRTGSRQEVRIQDIWSKALVYGGYSIASKDCSSTERRHAVVRIHHEEYRALKGYYLGLATKRSLESLSLEFVNFPFEPWAGIKQQRWDILKAVNKKRKIAGLEKVDASVMQKKRTPYKLMVPEKCALVQSELALIAKRNRLFGTREAEAV